MLRRRKRNGKSRLRGRRGSDAVLAVLLGAADRSVKLMDFVLLGTAMGGNL